MNYLITCNRRSLQYVGETVQKLNIRFNWHKTGFKLVSSNHRDDCYLCIVGSVEDCIKESPRFIVYPDIHSIRRPVPHSDLLIALYFHFYQTNQKFLIE